MLNIPCLCKQRNASRQTDVRDIDFSFKLIGYTTNVRYVHET